MEPLGVIPKPFRMESPFKWRVTMKVNHSEMKAVANGSWNDAQMMGLGTKLSKSCTNINHWIVKV